MAKKRIFLRMRLTFLPFLLLLVPLVEIGVFIAVGGRIGIGWTLALILLTAILGSVLLRIQGFQVIERIRREADAGRLPGRELGNGVMILIAGVLLLTPGFVTDTLGFLLFVPLIRDAIWRFLRDRITVAGAGMASGGRMRDPDRVVDLGPGEFTAGPSGPNRPDSPWRGENGRGSGRH